ncbi:MAG: preprotein translocase subunit SecG [Christensenellaceae bacterium]|jgi:preprotein translocase subunit SecG|nr:preprotein translocase subunit SecG [Christensenellaceae bacterium]
MLQAITTAQARDILNGFMIASMVLMVVFSVAMILIVALQEGTNANLGSISGASESFFGKNRAKTTEAKLKRVTAYIGIGILVFSIIFFILSIIKNNIPA